MCDSHIPYIRYHNVFTDEKMILMQYCTYKHETYRYIIYNNNNNDDNKNKFMYGLPLIADTCVMSRVWIPRDITVT